jgi:hypothetical protein
MKIFTQYQPATDFDTLKKQIQAKVEEASASGPKELVAVKSRMGGHQMQLVEVPAGLNFVLAK